MDYEKKQPTANCIVARLVPSWGSIVSLLFKTTEPYEHYYDEHGEEVPYGAIASWTDVELPSESESEDEKIKKTAIKILKGVARLVFEHEGVSKESVLAYVEKQKEQKSDNPCDGCNNYKGCINCVDGDQWAHIVECKPLEWSDNFEENIRNLLHEKLNWTSDDGSLYSAVFIDDKTLKDIISGIWFYVGKEALKYPNKELNAAEWSEEDEKMFESFMHKLEVCNLLSNKEFRWAKLRLKSLKNRGEFPQK